MENSVKFLKAIASLKSGVEVSFQGDITTEAEFNQVRWKTGVDSEGATIDTTTNPHSELTWTKVNNAMTALQTAYDGIGAVQRNRAKEYPNIADQLDEIYHNGIDSWKSMIKVTKDKYLK
jgi:hypothetical protein